MNRDGKYSITLNPKDNKTYKDNKRKLGTIMYYTVSANLMENNADSIKRENIKILKEEKKGNDYVLTLTRNEYTKLKRLFRSYMNRDGKYSITLNPKDNKTYKDNKRKLGTIMYYTVSANLMENNADSIKRENI